jgi:2-succinyl-6-hydroxy-2,4-cyclohexadiene-1-carboxylate synthase
MALHVERRGAGPRLVLAHGFTQTGRSWGPVADDLATDHEVLLPDAPGHGGSGDLRADLVEAADLLDAQVGPATYLGYSMGARWCLHLALAHPDRVQGLVLLGGTAGLADPAERAARVAADAALAAALDRDGVDAFLERWVAQSLFAGVPPEAVGMEDRRRNTATGLRSSLERAGTGAQEPLWDRLAELAAVPVLVLAGEHDDKFSALGRTMAEAIGPSASFHQVPGAGHAAHLEQPAALLALVRPWLAERGL